MRIEEKGDRKVALSFLRLIIAYLHSVRIFAWLSYKSTPKKFECFRLQVFEEIVKKG